MVTLAAAEMDFFRLDPRIRRFVIGGRGDSRGLVEAVRANLARVRRVRRALREAGAPVAVAFVGATNILVLLAAIGLGIRVVISERNDPGRQPMGRGWRVMRRLLYRRAAVVTANSRGALRTLGRFVAADRLAYVENPIVPPPAAARARRAPTILTIGRLHEQKAHDVLLEAFARIAAELPEWRLAVVGDGERRQTLQHLATARGIASRVDWHAAAADPFVHYRAAEVFALPSRWEGTPNALLEAMSCGLPVVVSDASPGPLEYVEDGVSGLVVPVDDPDALAGALRRLAADAALRERLGAAARARVATCDVASVLATWDRVLGIVPA